MVTRLTGSPGFVRWAIAAVVFLSSPALARAERTTRHFGKPIQLKDPVPIQDVARQLEKYKGRRILISGTVRDVCQNKGCWMTLQGVEPPVRITFEGYRFFVPRDSRGKKIIAEGILKKETISEETARHLAAESGRIESPEDVKGPQQVLRFVATGVEISD
ncbi:MAG: DUF4920 domain-containing protein [Acidobacteriota bacterium]